MLGGVCYRADSHTGSRMLNEGSNSLPPCMSYLHVVLPNLNMPQSSISPLSESWPRLASRFGNVIPLKPILCFFCPSQEYRTRRDRRLTLEVRGRLFFLSHNHARRIGQKGEEFRNQQAVVRTIRKDGDGDLDLNVRVRN
jgi:hypothetical protein